MCVCVCVCRRVWESEREGLLTRLQEGQTNRQSLEQQLTASKATNKKVRIGVGLCSALACLRTVAETLQETDRRAGEKCGGAEGRAGDHKD